MTITARTTLWTAPIESTPPAVEEILSYCRVKRLPLVLSRNEAAGSCRDASEKRFRAERVGIPLSDEMKTLVVTYKDGAGLRKYAALHCRGDRAMDFKLAARVLEPTGCGRLSLLDGLLLMERFGMRYGICNPLLLAARSSIRQVFDTGLFLPSSGGFSTVMTNAGEFTWGMELLPSELVRAIPASIIHSIAQVEKEVLS